MGITLAATKIVELGKTLTKIDDIEAMDPPIKNGDSSHTKTSIEIRAPRRKTLTLMTIPGKVCRRLFHKSSCPLQLRISRIPIIRITVSSIPAMRTSETSIVKGTTISILEYALQGRQPRF
ncbi:hypothetical protein ACJ73_07754 [Blastomyces percursus]|uniref:Uncharacterized protein n=1 Tax=Blastomyces percursus TaxID=1658174 RepID=A0A1J9QYI4_9EURO|nr:hypothetical protein ACJ73_07754 [Blastomyces percursus]